MYARMRPPMTKTQDGFTQQVRSRLAARAGYRCSFPGCYALTVGPSSESPADFASIGVAAHIEAASEGGPRWRATMPSEERSSIENGIWLCQTHARLIDVDATTYPVNKLRDFKSQHETIIQNLIGQQDLRPSRALLDGVPISIEATSILLSRTGPWEHMLWAQLLRDEILSMRSDARAFRHRISLKPTTDLPADILAQQISEYLDMTISLLETYNSVIAVSLPNALGDPGRHSDLDELAWVARQVAAIYRSAVSAGSMCLQWRSDDDRFSRIVFLAPSVAEKILIRIEGLPEILERAARESVESGGLVPVDASVDFPEEFLAAIEAWKQGVAKEGSYLRRFFGKWI
jgi:hypothetical protein